MPSFLVQTLGCKLNQLESEAITDAFLQAGFGIYNQASGSDLYPSLIIVNTCTVTSKADQKARRVIRKALRDYPGSRIIVTGCYAQLNRDELLKLDTVKPVQRLFVISKDSILGMAEYLLNDDIAGASFESGVPSSQFAFNPKVFSSHTRSFLKIQDGCNNHCTYCRIRLARGPSISLEAEQVLERLKILEKDHAEAVIAGVNISQYCDISGRSEVNLAGLLEYLLSGTEKISLRLSSLAPGSVDENLAEVLSHNRIRPHFHLSIQSGSKKILERMGRGYDSQTAERAAALLRCAKADPFLACDIITGFPGETHAEFKETLAMCERIGFAWIHVFPYSKRQGTAAFSYTGAVHEADVTERVQQLTALAKKGRAEYVRRWLGCEVEVLLETDSKSQSSGYSRGVSENYLKVLVKTEGAMPLPGTMMKCRLLTEGDFEDFDAQGR